MDKARMMVWLLRADALFREKLSAPELEVLADLWTTALQRSSEEAIENGFREWFTTGKYFPKPADIVEIRLNGIEDILRRKAIEGAQQ